MESVKAIIESMALNIKKIEGPLAAFEVEDTSRANAIVTQARACEGMDLNLKEDERRGSEGQRSKQEEINERVLWYKRLWVISRS